MWVILCPRWGTFSAPARARKRSDVTRGHMWGTKLPTCRELVNLKFKKAYTLMSSLVNSEMFAPGFSSSPVHVMFILHVHDCNDDYMYSDYRLHNWWVMITVITVITVIAWLFTLDVLSRDSWTLSPTRNPITNTFAEAIGHKTSFRLQANPASACRSFVQSLIHSNSCGVKDVSVNA